MKKTPLIFSITKEQSLFMTAIMSLLSFMAVLSFGIALMIGTGAARWNAQWDLSATVQVMPGSNPAAAEKILQNNRDKFSNMREIDGAEMQRLLRPWLSGGGSALGNYLPKMYELKFKRAGDMKTVAAEIGENARFLTHAESLKPAMGASLRMIAISGALLALVLGALGFCISFITKNTADLHKRELEILNQVGAKDSFVAKQMQIIVGKICARAAGLGFVAAAPVLMFIIAAARGARVGLMAMLGLGGGAWVALMLLPVAIIIFAVYIARKTTMKLLCD
ncbi:MAG: hypothetical protein LBJ18_03905 [Rickettsiales bacterium]|jgi:cell division transport system permease protein|nr:hypothetical protein [Rickettsiales bacterium]